MDNRYYVHKLDKPVNWVVEVPGSKSVTNRALLMAALAAGTTTLKGYCLVTIQEIFLLVCSRLVLRWRLTNRQRWYL